MDSTKIMQMISYAGYAKTKIMEAMHSAIEGELETAHNLMKEADKDLEMCHQAQTDILFDDCKDISATNHNISVLLIHAMDQVMDTMKLLQRE